MPIIYPMNITATGCQHLGIDVNVEFDNVCPLCGLGINMIPSNGIIHAFSNIANVDDFDGTDPDSVPDDGTIVCVHRCPTCNGLFITYHDVMFYDGAYQEEKKDMYPSLPLKHSDYVEVLKTLSPRFYDLYAVAAALESVGNHVSTGNILRIALECLVTDYAIFKHPNDKADILKLDLSHRIDKYFSDFAPMRMLADAVRRIGNGYSHYVCEYTDTDIDNMRMYLDSICLHVYQELRIDHQLATAVKYVGNKGGNPKL